MKTVDDISELPKNFLDCRDRGHAWFDAKNEPALRRASGGLAIRTLVCSRCHTTREDYIVRTSGEVWSRRYMYPDGYCFSKGVGHQSASLVRSLAVRAAFAAMRSRRIA